MTQAAPKHFHLDRSNLFIFGLAVVMLTFLNPYFPGYHSFIHMWQAEVMAGLLLLSTFAILLVSKPSVAQPIRVETPYHLIFPLVAFSLWSLLSTLWAPSWRSSLHHTFLWSAFILFYLIFKQIVSTERGYRRLLTMLTIVLVLHAIPVVVEYEAFLVFGGSSTLGMRFAKYGELVNTLLPLILVAVVRSTGKKFVLGTVAIVLLWLLVFCSFGRINILLFAAAFSSTVITILIFKRFRSYKFKALGIGLACLLVLLPLNAPAFFASGVSEIPIAQRLGDEAGMSSSNGFRKLMISLSLEMFKSKPIVGVGADNFGTEVNKYRKAYAENIPADPNLAFAESEIPERAHNEFLQVLSELGIVGLGLFLWFLIGILIVFLRSRRPFALRSIAAFFGIGCFLVSSLVSSYSFRFVQNGLVFFIVLAVLSNLSNRRRTPERSLEPVKIRIVCSAGIMVSLLLLAYHVPRAVAAYRIARAEQSSYEDARSSLASARTLDPESPIAYRVEGMLLFERREFAEASRFLQRMIDLGHATSTDFSYLASSQFLSNDIEGAEKTLKEAISLYPHSTFLRVRLSVIQSALGKVEESNDQFEFTKTIDARQALTWRNFIERGAEYASHRSFAEKLPGVMDLHPNQAIYAVQREREIRFPEEKSKIDFGSN